MNAAQPLRLLTELGLPFEAEHLKLVLADRGIECFLEGMYGASNLSLNSGIGSIRVMVPVKDFQQAREILGESRERHDADWYCAKCREDVAASFDLCWKCGGLRADVEGPRPEQPLPSPDDFTAPAAARAAGVKHNPSPYAAPRTLDPLTQFEMVDPQRVRELDETINYAYRASLIGVIIPVLFHLYSLLLLLGALSIDAPYSPSTRRKFYVALGIDLAVLGILAYGFFSRVL